MIRILVVAAFASLLISCATTSTKRVEIDPEQAALEEARQKILYVTSQGEGQERVQRLTYPMLRNAAPLCDDDVRPSLGIIPANIHAWPRDYQEAAAIVWGVEERVSVGLIIEGGPAHSSGLQEDDILVSVAGKKVPKGKKATEKTWKLVRKNAEPGVPVEVAVERDGQPMVFTVVPEVVCDSYAFLIGGSEVNAYADGQGIYITTGMLNFAENDAELTTVIGHELAHNAMDHIDKKSTNYLLGSILDIAAAAYGVNTQGAFGGIAAQAYSQDFEAEADYVGLYILAIGGYPIDQSAAFWRRMGTESPGSIASTYNSTHPGTAERYLALDEIEQEIYAKKLAGLPLEPELKE